jgi:ribosomal protein S18 acetylase RimI-like enzyme
MADHLTVDENLRCAMTFFGNATGTGDVATLGGTVGIFSGLDYGVFNIAMLSGPVSYAAGGFDVRLAEAARYFKQRGVRWSFWLCEDLLEPGLRRRARHSMAECGLRAISHPPGMIAAALTPPKAPLPVLEVKPVTTDTLRRSFTEITSISFDIPYQVAHTVYAHERAWAGAYQGYVGLHNGRAVAIMAIVETPGAIGVYSLATHPLYRRQGFGESLFRAVLSERQQKNPGARIVLQSTDLGYPLYKRMGFREVTKFSVYLTR